MNGVFNFAAGSAPAGFRLHHLELLNWGTFHGRVWRIDPQGETALLTGENGSGKSTLVDALLTLLVPNQKRSYNQASGSDRKKERNELSYVRGAYGKIQSEDDISPKIQYLRDKESYSVILGHFQNVAFNSELTLAQFFWQEEGVVKKFYVVSTTPLTIQTHFSQFETVAELKKRLRKQHGVELFDQFNQYDSAFRKLLAIRSEKALDLFNQTISIKEIGDLNDFIRTHMLEKTEAQAKVQGLIESFDHLTTAYQAMVKAEQQLAILRPLLEEARKHQQAQTKLNQLLEIEKIIPIYFAGIKSQLLLDAIRENEQKHQQAQLLYEQANLKIGELDRQKTDLNIAISNDETGRRLRDIGQQILFTEQTLRHKKGEAEKYNRLAQEFNLPPYATEQTFYESRQKGEENRPVIEKHLAVLTDEIGQLQIRQHDLKNELLEVEQELDSLRQRKSQIPAENLRLRQQILEALNILEQEIPFVGELLRVKEGEQVWEGAIERLLHNFGLRLLVPEKHYQAVSRYVNSHQLNGRVVFHRISEEKVFPAPFPADKKLLVHKLQIKPAEDNFFYNWLQQELQHHYDYHCCDTLADFDRAHKAITPEGLTKSGGHRHEKDDRHRLNDRRRYILGWSNLEKIQALESEAKTLKQKLGQCQKELEEKQKSHKNSIAKQISLNQFLAISDFNTIDWRQEQEKINQLQAQKERLEQSSNQLKQLQEELKQVEMQLAQAKKTAEEQARLGSKLEFQIQQYRQQHEECKREWQTEDPAKMKEYKTLIRQYIPAEITLPQADQLRRQAEIKLRDEKEIENRRLSSFMGRVTKLMQEYKDKYPAETADFDVSVEAIPEFEKEFKRLEHDDLPRFADRFKELLNEKVTQGITYLRADLESEIEKITEQIEQLNGSLYKIDYTPDTYIELKTEATRSAEVREFKQELRACIPDVGIMSKDGDYEPYFLRIQKLINRFKEDQRWTNKVTDVRQWLEFAAVEKYRTDNSQKHYYSDSSGKSGGQKAKLAYTILASAIAFQYGLEMGEKQSKSFRFVVVDEAFSRSDEANSRYAMSLFKALQLQLLVVTPMTGIHIVEPYISACHYVWNNSEGNYSQVRTLTIREFQQERQQFQKP